jgi:ATP-binding cassette subfamily B protein
MSWGGHWGSASAPGLPFAGVPPEIRPEVERMLAAEPPTETSATTFSHRGADTQHLSIRAMLKRQRGRVAFASVLLVIETLTLQAGPVLAQIGIDRGVVPKDLQVLLLAAAAYLLAVVATGLASAFRVRVSARFAARAMTELRLRVFSHLQRLSLDFFTEEQSGVIMTRMTSDIEALQQLLQEGLVNFAVQGLTMTVVLVILFVYNAQLALLTVFLVVPVLTVMSIWFRRASNRGYRRVRDGIARVLADLSEGLHGIKVVIAYNRQRHNVLHHRNVVGGYRDANLGTAKINSVYAPGTDMVGVLGQAALLLIGGRMVLKGELTIGQLTAFLLFVNAFFQPIQQLVQIYNLYQQGNAAILKLRTLLETEPSVTEAEDARELPQVEGEIVFEHVSFGYDPARPVLRHVDLRIAPGETVAFVGRTGAGKSTMAKLVSRFYDPTEGRILVDGHDLRALSLRSLRRQLGVVPQEPFLFAGSIRDNVTFARPDATAGDVHRAVEAMGLTELVESLPDGLDTDVHERGQSLSSGERQLLALARAFLAQPRVLVLDEATSNLDLRSEAKIERALDTLLEGRTAILIAHRLSTAMRADRIVVVDDGEIAEIGSHAALVARGGRYAEMYATWVEQARGSRRDGPRRRSLSPQPAEG